MENTNLGEVRETEKNILSICKNEGMFFFEYEASFY
jgi:hypothetical protein